MENAQEFGTKISMTMPPQGKEADGSEGTAKESAGVFNHISVREL